MCPVWRILTESALEEKLSSEGPAPRRETPRGTASLPCMSPLEQLFLISLALTAAAQLYIERRLRRR